MLISLTANSTHSILGTAAGRVWLMTEVGRVRPERNWNPPADR